MLLKKYWLARKIQFEVGSEYLRDNIGAGCVLLPLSICGTSLLANFSQKEHFSRHQLCMYATLSITLATFGDRKKIGIILMFGTCGQSDLQIMARNNSWNMEHMIKVMMRHAVS